MFSFDYRSQTSFTSYGYPGGQIGGGFPAYGSPYGSPMVGGGVAPFQITQMLQQILQSLSQLAGAWGNLLASPTPAANPFGPPPQSAGPGNPALPTPSDPNDYASYLQAQRLGGTLEGKTGIAQRDAIPGTRFGQVQNSTGWQASVARNYAYQFAAYAVGADALTPEGVKAGQQALPQMAPDAQLFTQVASVFKGNLLGGPGFYNNPGLKQLLASRGLGELANRPGVGETDVQSIGAITIALNQGKLSLNDVINSGAIDNMDRYFQVIQYVQQGQFGRDLQFYDSVPLG